MMDVMDESISSDSFCCSPFLVSASEHYNGGRFSFAVKRLELAIAEEKKRKTNNHLDMSYWICILAAEADAALCRVRAVAATSSSAEANKNNDDLLSDALERQLVYRNVLKREMESIVQRRSQGHHNINPQRSQQGDNNNMLFTKFVSSILLSSVAESWIQTRLNNLSMAFAGLCTSIQYTAALANAFYNKQQHSAVVSLPLFDPMTIVNQTVTLHESLHSLRHVCSKDEKACLAYSKMQHALSSLQLFDNTNFGAKGFQTTQQSENLVSGKGKVNHNSKDYRITSDHHLPSNLLLAHVDCQELKEEEEEGHCSNYNKTSSTDHLLHKTRRKRKCWWGGEEDTELTADPQKSRLLSQHFLLSALYMYYNLRRGGATTTNNNQLENKNEMCISNEKHQNKKLPIDNNNNNKAIYPSMISKILFQVNQSLMYNPLNQLALKVKMFFSGLMMVWKHENKVGDTKLEVGFLQEHANSSSIASHLLGCYHCYYQRNYHNALRSFQHALDILDNKTNDYVVDECRPSVMNMALCFSYLGEAVPATEILLYLLSSKQQPTNKDEETKEEQDESTTMAQQQQRSSTLLLLVTKSGIQIGVHASAAAKQNYWDERCILLWRLFHAASYAQDFATCISATKEICDNSHPHDICYWKAMCAYLFSLLQSHRPSLVINVCNENSCCLIRFMDNSIGSNNNNGPPSSLSAIKICYHLYEADARIQCSEAKLFLPLRLLSPNDEKVQEDAETAGQKSLVNENSISSLTQLAVAELDSLVVSGSTEESLFISSARNKLQSIAYNNHGVALVFSGLSHAAMKSFRASLDCFGATTSADKRVEEDIKDVIENTKNSSMLTLHFNLALLLWREDHLDEASRLWLTSRGVSLAWDGVALGRVELLQNAMQQAIYKHCQLTAKEMPPSDYADHHHHQVICEWKDERGQQLVYIKELHVATFDILVLKYAITKGKKMAALRYQKTVGGLLGKSTKS